ncbi:hypothetical protein [Paracoccus aminovorans]|uniref:hypothetical protein n=1 Tax=Paracoccus aminovorans TaxID=34004 RepID=UPI0007825867|nr:hypothetical protein [Paracoccus aminovorans]MDQ7776554.1 hypothetical protein [Paracoccus aminovorans]
MAITTDFHAPRLPALFDRLLAAFRRGGEADFARLSRRAEIEALQAKSDAQLAELGLTRDRIVHHVFADRIWF